MRLRLPARYQNQIELRVDFPGLDGREDGAEGGVRREQSPAPNGIGLYPLRQDSVGAQPSERGLIELAREQAGHAGTIRVRRLGEDQVVVLARREQELAAIADDDVHLWVGEHVAVDRAADLGNVEDRRFQ